MAVKKVGGSPQSVIEVTFSLQPDAKTYVKFNINGCDGLEDQELTPWIGQLMMIINQGGLKEACIKAINQWGEDSGQEQMATDIIRMWAMGEKVFQVKNPSAIPVTADTALLHLSKGSL